MRIKYEKDVAMTLMFATSELKVALAVLKALHKAMPADFISNAIYDLEQDLKPKQTPLNNHHHICTRCCMMMDDREGNALHYVKGDKDVWFHQLCPELKKNRPE